jgi:hypothetical protein
MNSLLCMRRFTRLKSNSDAVKRRLAQVGGRDAQRLAVLGHGAARALDALLLEHLGDLAVRQRLLDVLGRHELLDQRAHRGARRVAAGLGAQRRAEEVLQLEGAERRRHVLGRGHARDGRLVQAQLVGDLAQHQRPHRELAVGEEVALPLDDRVGHAQDGVEALLDVLDEPARLLQPLLQRLVALAAVRLQRAGIDVVHAQPRHHVGIELHPEAGRACRGPTLVTSTSGTMMLRSTSTKRRPGLGSSRVISPSPTSPAARCRRTAAPGA